MPDKPTLALERWSKIVIGCGLALTLLQMLAEFGIVGVLLEREAVKPTTYFDWKPPGTLYIGLVVLVIGAAMLVFAALIPRREDLPERGDVATDPPGDTNVIAKKA